MESIDKEPWQAQFSIHYGEVININGISLKLLFIIIYLGKRQ